MTSILSSWFTSNEVLKPKPPIAHIFVDCISVRDPFKNLNELVRLEMLKSTNVEYHTYLTYVASMGTDTIDLVDALQLIEVISSHTASRRIIVQKKDACYVGMLLAHEIGKCIMQASNLDVVFVVSSSTDIVSACMHVSTPHIPIRRLDDAPPPEYSSLVGPDNNVVLHNAKPDNNEGANNIVVLHNTGPDNIVVLHNAGADNIVVLHNAAETKR